MKRNILHGVFVLVLNGIIESKAVIRIFPVSGIGLRVDHILGQVEWSAVSHAIDGYGLPEIGSNGVNLEGVWPRHRGDPEINGDGSRGIGWKRKILYISRTLYKAGSTVAGSIERNRVGSSRVFVVNRVVRTIQKQDGDRGDRPDGNIVLVGNLR